MFRREREQEWQRCGSTHSFVNTGRFDLLPGQSSCLSKVEAPFLLLLGTTYLPTHTRNHRYRVLLNENLTLVCASLILHS